MATCNECGASIFFALTVNGERQALDVEPHPDGSVMAYRADVKLWYARTLPRPTPAGAGEQLPLDGVGDDPRPRRERAPHVLEQPYKPHAATCSPPRRAVQGDLFAVGSPAPREQANRRIYNVKTGASHNVPAPRQGGAKVYEWDKEAPRIAARRRRTTGRTRDAGAS